MTLERPIDLQAKLADNAEADIRLLYPPMRQGLEAVQAELAAKGLRFVLYSGFRTFKRQGELYFSGRTRPGPIKTNAMAGYSAHNYALAGDLYLEVDGGASWPEAYFRTLGECAERHGLAWAGRWKTFPEKDHLYWPGYATADELRPLRQLAQAHLVNPLLGATDWLTAVWDYVSAHNPKEPNA